MSNTKTTSEYRPLLVSAGLGSILGAGVIIGLSTTITIWQKALDLTASQVGLVSSLLTLAIAAGSLLAGQMSKMLGLIRSYNWSNLLFAIGTILMLLAQNFGMLAVGALIAGFFSGADLPISLTLISHDAPNEKATAEIVSGTQIYWTVGIFLSSLIAFLTSTMSGTWSPRIVMGVLTLLALYTGFYRMSSSKLRQFHEQAQARQKQNSDRTAEKKEKVSVFSFLFKKDSHQYLGFFLCILIFYACWNLLANTFGQFQTYMLVKANASQSFATGATLLLTFLNVLVAVVFAKFAGGKYRNLVYGIGIIVNVGALIGLAVSGSSLTLIVAWLAMYYIGAGLAGEGLYKVWTQESFPTDYRLGIQGFINGFSRLCCAAFALITPVLVLPENIYATMIGFAIMMVFAGVVGWIQIRMQKKYHIGIQ